ncbi:MAG: cell division protein FtsA [Muribaculum sp.]|nr:cell division protein FtsA [Muribaculum sp.]
MNNDKYIAALEISSSKVIGAVGIAGKSGQLEIIAVEQEKSTDSVRYGQIQNTEESSKLANYVLERLERRPNVAPREITGVYVGLSGRSLRSIPIDVSISLPDDTEISDAIIGRLRTDALTTAIDSSLEIVDAVPRIFKVGKTETHRPIGMMGNGVSATYDLIVARPAIQSNLKRVIKDKLGLDIKGIVVTPLATGYVVLSEQEKKLGCMLVDIGSETTTVTIYSRGNLVYFATLPLGGRNITRDLTSLNELEEKAEELKQNFGNALSPSSPSQVKVGRHKQSDISNIVVARAEEIVANIIEQPRYAGLKDTDIPEGIVLCGGGARLNGLTDLISKISGLKVRMATMPSYIRMTDNNGQGMDSLQLAAIMYAGAEKASDECLQIPEDPEVSEPTVNDTKEQRETPIRVKKPSIFNRIGNKLGRIFTPIDDDDEGDELS